MVPTQFNTENRTYRQLLGNGLVYRVPPFQRQYSWGQEEWEDLWADLQATLPEGGEPAHYLGYLVLQTTDHRIFEVIDGQQRLTTVSLIVLAAMRLLGRYVGRQTAAEANQKRLDQLRSTYIGSLDPVTLTTRNKLSLGYHDDPYYRNYLVTLADPLPQRGFPASTQALRLGLEWFEQRLRDRVTDQADPGRALAQLVETMSDRLFFTVITVADQLNAYKVFETLNARGVRLSATDLLKNYLFAVLDDQPHAQHQITELERRWEAMVGRLGGESFPDFVHIHWNSRQGFARPTELFRSIRQRIVSREEVFALLPALDEDIDTYLALTQPEGSSWPLAWKQSVRELLLFGVRQPFALLMAARRRLSDPNFGALLRATVAIAFRANVIGGQYTSQQERIYHQAALQVHRGEVTRLDQVLSILRPIYPGDRVFRADFAEKSIRTTQSSQARLVRYILARLERQAGGAHLDPGSLAYSLEHLLPQSPQNGWDAFPDRDLDSYIYRLANMVLLEAASNRAVGNRSYAEKRPVLLDSGILLTRQLAHENQVWTPERLQARQQSLAHLAVAVWRVAQFV